MDYIGGWRKFHAVLICFFITFFGDKKIAFKSPFGLYFYPFIIEYFLICVATVQNRGKDTHQGCYVVDISRSAERRVFLFSYERLWRGLWETIVYNKSVSEVLDMKYKSEFKYALVNPEAVAWRCLVKKVFLKVSQNSQENNCTRVSF